MKKINVLHIARIDNDISKGTSAIIPQYIIYQNNCQFMNVAFLNCNNEKIKSLSNYCNIFNKEDNINMNVIINFKPDIVIFHELYIPYYLKIYKYLLVHNIPYIIIPHGGMTVNAQKNKLVKKKLGNLLLFYNFFKNSKMIQYLSENEKKNTKFKKLKSCVLGNGIKDIPNYNYYLNLNTRKCNNELKIIYVGRYEYFIKGIDQLLMAAKLIKDRGDQGIYIELFGKGNKKNYNRICEFVKKNKLEDVVKINVPIYGKDKVNKILENDVFIQVSRTEGQPLGVMEALSYGMPCILSDGTGYKEIISNFKIGINTKTDSEDIYKSILELKNNMYRLRKFSNNAYSYAKEMYSWENIVNKSLDLYLEIVS